MTTHVSKNTNLLFDHNDTIIVTGKLTILGLSYLSSNDAVYVRGNDDTVSIARSNSNHVYDQGHGTHLVFGAPAFNEVVSGLQNDLKGTVTFANAVTYHLDGHGGVLATGSGLSADFLGFHSVAQLESHVKTA